ncbi:hypothetical protein QOL99_04740 [Deinococcus sp. MIMF12]|uniref:Uncharacterized protein n=1 Tax=Deinococcus rhizophilus TaxID=3049544 RepID=A0ABT7JFV4_9DEIO|nr:hypothetical protein [Deinococcus rhizophilus]MDL2343457.1 hypothetical protein [Deinococcus rhizophilus]
MNKVLSLILALGGSFAAADVQPVPTALSLPAARAPLGQTATIDWNAQTVTVEGAATTRPGLSQAQAYLQGKAAATADAQRLLAVALAGVRVDAQTTVKDFELQNDDISTRVSAVVRGQIVGEPRIERMPDGSSIVFVKMSAPLGSATNLLKVLTPRPPAPRITVNVTNINVVTVVRPAPTARFAGLIIDARGTDFSPCLLPRIYSMDGSLLWTYNAMDVRSEGVSGYARSVGQAQRMTERGGHAALIVQALAADRCNVIVSRQEADMIRAYDRATGFLSDFNVTLVF